MQLDEYTVRSEKELKEKLEVIEGMVADQVRELKASQRSGSTLAKDMVQELKTEIQEKFKANDVELDFRLSEIERRA